MAKTSGGNMPTTVQEKFPNGMDTSPSTAVPRCKDHDLEFTPSRTRFGVWGDEQTYTVRKRGNCVTEGKNY